MVLSFVHLTSLFLLFLTYASNSPSFRPTPCSFSLISLPNFFTFLFMFRIRPLPQSHVCDQSVSSLMNPSVTFSLKIKDIFLLLQLSSSLSFLKNNTFRAHHSSPWRTPSVCTLHCRLTPYPLLPHTIKMFLNNFIPNVHNFSLFPMAPSQSPAYIQQDGVKISWWWLLAASTVVVPLLPGSFIFQTPAECNSVIHFCFFTKLFLSADFL